MKKLLFLLFAVSFFSSCKKSSSEEELPERYIQFKTDGNKITYLKGGVSVWAEPPGYIARGYMNVEDKSSISVGIHNVEDIELNKEYVYPGSEVYIYYIDEAGVSYANYGYPSLSAKIKITEINSSYISGTFSGTVKNESGATVNITEGRFKQGRLM